MTKIHLLILCLFGFIQVYSQPSVSLKNSLSEKKHQVVCVAYSPDSEMIASGGFDNQIIIWSSETGSVIKRFTGLKGFPLSLAFTSDSKYLISGGKDFRITIWDISAGKEVRSVKAHSNDVTEVAVSSDNAIASASKDKSIKIWDINGNLLREIKGHTKEVMALAFSHNGQQLVSGSADGTVKEWEVASGKMVRSIDAHDGWVRTVAYNHNSTLIASGGDDGKIQIWNRSNGQLQNSIIAHSKWLETLSFSPDGKYIVSGGHDNYLVIVNATTGEIVFNSPKQDYYVLSTAFDPSGSKLVSSVLNSTQVSVWDVTALSIRAMNTALEKPKEKSVITWKTLNNQQSESLTYIVNANIKSDSPLSSVELFLNEKWFFTKRDFSPTAFPGEIMFEQAVFLNEGRNKIKLIVYNDAGETGSEILNVEFSEKEIAKAIELKNEEPKLAAEKVEVAQILPEQKMEVKAEEAKFGVGKVVSAKQAAEVEVEEGLTYNLPRNKQNPFRFALIIGNEDYSSYQTGLETEANVAFAVNDATAFREFAINILGIPKDNVIFITNARAIEMDNAIAKLNPIIKALNGKAEVFFYYAGHGFPDEKTKEPYLVPVDVSGTNLRFAVKLKDLYASLSEHPSARITVFLDACFSGGAREQGLVSARAVKVKPKEELLKGNLVVFSASSGSESSLPYKDKQHGLFTYYLLSKLKETQGEITYKELSEHLSAQVGVRSVMVNSKPQTPQTNVSYDAENVWGNWKIK